MATIPFETQQQWRALANTNIAKPFRKRAFEAALKTLESGKAAEAAIVAAKQAEQSRANYMALSALVLGALSAALAFFFGGVSILATIFAIASAMQGRRSEKAA
ncbi:MAG TPA: hypothetical protein VHO95_11550, partial [Candidatus Dormibacteraeota bacterium]|nr:hypothetical protein [Candidatus Dormibacteraeota bacterium]